MLHDSAVHEQTLNEYFDRIGMKYEENVNFDDFVNMIKNNCKLKEKDEGKAKAKNKSLDMNLKALYCGRLRKSWRFRWRK